MKDKLQSVNIKFWNEKTEQVTFNVGDHIKVENVVVDVFKDKVSLNTTDETQAEVCDFY